MYSDESLGRDDFQEGLRLLARLIARCHIAKQTAAIAVEDTSASCDQQGTNVESREEKRAADRGSPCGL